MAVPMRLRAVLAVAVALVGAVVGQFGVFDLQANSDTMMVGTTETVLPSCFSTPDGAQNDLIAWYNFDDAFGLDHSGHANHATNPVPDVGPGHQGRGSSAHFNGEDNFVVGHSTDYDGLQQMTVSFWMYLLTDSTESWRVVFRKGDG